MIYLFFNIVAYEYLEKSKTNVHVVQPTNMVCDPKLTVKPNHSKFSL